MLSLFYTIICFVGYVNHYTYCCRCRWVWWTEVCHAASDDHQAQDRRPEDSLWPHIPRVSWYHLALFLGDHRERGGLESGGVRAVPRDEGPEAVAEVGEDWGGPRSGIHGQSHGNLQEEYDWSTEVSSFVILFGIMCSTNSSELVEGLNTVALVFYVLYVCKIWDLNRRVEIN